MKSARIFRLFSILMALCLILPGYAGSALAQPANSRTTITHNVPGDGGDPIFQLNSLSKTSGKDGGQEGEGDDPLARAEWFYGQRTAGDPNVNFTLAQAAELRAKAAEQVANEAAPKQASPEAYSGGWTAFGPDPIVQVARTSDAFLAMAGRIGALEIGNSAPYTMYLGAANGGIWISSTLTGGWTPKTDDLASLAIGAIAIAPSNEQIVYVGTGEGALSGDSYFGNGVLKSTNGGQTFTQVSGTTFNQVSISKIVVDPTNPNHLYVSTLRGIAGARRLRPPFPTPYGIWESMDGGASWAPRLVTNDQFKGAVDLVMDPLHPNELYASFWSEGIVKSTDGGVTWHPAMSGFPENADYTIAPTRMALTISHPPTQTQATLYAGFEWFDTDGNYHPSTVWKSTDGATSWSETNTDVVGGYCGTSENDTQCYYDNVLAADPNNPNIIFAGGLFNYSTGTGGIFRSMDGGATWLDMGYHQHPDFHAIVISKSQPGKVVIGNDGGVWYSDDYGGRLNPGDDVTTVDWVNLNGTVDPNTGAVIKRTGLQIAQFTSIGQNPSSINEGYGGTQDNGTLRKFGSKTWYDFSSGDGGQVLVDWISPLYVYGTFYDISPYRFDEGMNNFFAYTFIYNGLDRTDRSAFYIPFTFDYANTNRLFLGTYRIYRSENRGDLWQPISEDLTTGCTNRNNSPTGYECVITALGTNFGSPALYVGTGDGLVYLSTDTSINTPVWLQVNKAPLPTRPVSAIAVDRSDYRVAYLAYSGFNAATPVQPGHVFKTTDGGSTWTDVSGNLPDIPVNSLIIDPRHPDTLYAGTDVGPMVTTNGGSSWSKLGTGFPIVPVHALNLNPYNGQLLAGTHGRGAWSLQNPTKEPALVLRKAAAKTPIGPSGTLTYTLTIQNFGNAPATGVVISDTIPANTTFVSASAGGSHSSGNVSWNIGTVPTGTVGTDKGLIPGSVSVTLAVQVGSNVAENATISNAQYGASSAEGIHIKGSPLDFTLANAYDLDITPSHQEDGTSIGKVITYTETIKNLGYNPDAYTLAVSGNKWPTTLWDASFTNQISQTGTLQPGTSTSFGVQVSVPLTATNGITDTAVVLATSTHASTAAAAMIQTTALNAAVLLVDEDGNAPDVQDIYRQALNAGNITYNVWDLKANKNISLNYMKAHKAIVWYTGTSYPGPIVPYEDELATYLDSGGRLFLSGMDLLDQSAGTTDFVKNYLHVDWNGTEIQNDKGTLTVTAVLSNPVTGGLGSFPMDYASLGYEDFSDQITPIPPAMAAFMDDKGEPDALTVEAGNYKVMFMAFPFEVMGTSADRSVVLKKALNWFGVSGTVMIYQPLIFKQAGATP